MDKQKILSDAMQELLDSKMRQLDVLNKKIERLVSEKREIDIDFKCLKRAAELQGIKLPDDAVKEQPQAKNDQ